MADQTLSQTSPAMKEAIAILYTAQHEYSAKNDYERFCNEVSTQHIPWDFEDRRFLTEIKKLKEGLVARLNLKNEEGLQAAANEVLSQTLSPEELEGMELGLQKTQQLKKDHREHIFQYTKSVVDGYVQQLKEQNAPITEEQEWSLRSSVARAAEEAAGVGDAAELQKTISSLISSEVEVPEEIQTAISNTSRLSKITETVLAAGDEIHKGMLVEQCLGNPDISPEIIANKFGGLREAKILSLSPEVRDQIETELADPNMRRAAFEKAAISAKQGISQPINDVITAIGGPQGKEFISSVIDTVLGTSIEEVKSGRPIAERPLPLSSNPLMQEKIQQMEQSLIQRKSARDAAPKISKPAFRQETMNFAAGLWGPQIQQGLLIYLQTASLGVSDRAPEYLHYFILAGTDVWNAILGRSTKAAINKTVKRTAVKLLEGGAQTTAMKAAGGGIFGGPVGLVVGAITGKVFSVLWGGIKGFFSFLPFGEIAKGITLGAGVPGQKKPLWERDLGLVVGIIIVLVILLLTGPLVGFGSFTSIREDSTTAAVVDEYEEGGASEGTQTPGRGSPHGDPAADAEWNAAVARESGVKREKKTPVDYTADPENAERVRALEASLDVTLLVTSSDPNYTPKITQMPGGSYTHGGVNAVDVGAPLQSMVHSPVAGTVIYVVNLYADGSGFAGSTDGGGYGNYIDIQTPEGYVLRVAHLAFNSMPAEGTDVSVGDVIGRSGQTGNSTGPHIHFEYRGSGAPNILTIFE